MRRDNQIHWAFTPNLHTQSFRLGDKLNRSVFCIPLTISWRRSVSNSHLDRFIVVIIASIQLPTDCPVGFRESAPLHTPVCIVRHCTHLTCSEWTYKARTWDTCWFQSSIGPLFPPQQSSFVLHSSMGHPEEVDIIVCGGGPAGKVLSTSGSFSLLLLLSFSLWYLDRL